MLTGLLCLAPALLLAFALLARRYPGEHALLAMRRRTAPLPRAPRKLAWQPRVFAVLARGGRLIGRSLAVRPPPGALLAR